MTIEDFRGEVRDWLNDNFSDKIKTAAAGSEEHKKWVNRLADKGWICPGWATEYGGAGLDFQHQITLMQELNAAGATLPPDNGGQARTMIGPTILEFGTEEQKLRHLPRIARSEVQWCQGYSEPGSGSDLASLATKAVLDGDNFVLNGQKIWTSGAVGSDWIYVLVRTNQDVPSTMASAWCWSI